MAEATIGGRAKRGMGIIEAAIRKTVRPGMRLGTVPRRAPFEVQELSEDAVVLLFGDRKTRTVISWSCLENLMQLLIRPGWVEIRAVHDTTGVSGSLDGCIKSNGGPRRTVGGYVAAVLEAAEVVDVDLNRPAKVRLRKDIAKRRRQPPEDESITEGSGADPLSGRLWRTQARLLQFPRICGDSDLTKSKSYCARQSLVKGGRHVDGQT